MADVLQKLFGSSARVKILRLFLFSPQMSFSFKDIQSRTRSRETRKETTLLLKIGFLERTVYRGKATFTLNPDFTYLAALRSLILNTPMRGKEIYAYVEKTGVIKLLVTSGIFMGEIDTGIDLLIVGDKIKESKLKDRLRALEAEVGKELRYTFLSTEEFFYRLNMSDRLVRDVFDFPHVIIYDRLDIGLK
jgi:hypothetical protein